LKFLTNLFRRQLAQRSGATLAALPGVILVVAILITLLAWAQARHTEDARVWETFLRESETVRQSLNLHLSGYDTILDAATGLLSQASGPVTPQRWAGFLETVFHDQPDPAVRLVGYVAARPPAAAPETVPGAPPGATPMPPDQAGDDEFHRLVLALEPTSRQPLPERDLSRHHGWRELAARARDSGLAALSPLGVSLAPGGDNADDLTLAVPVFRTPVPPATLAERRQGLLGWAVLTLSPAQLLAGLHQGMHEQLAVMIVDTTDPARKTMIYYRPSAGPAADLESAPALYRLSYPFSCGGRQWSIDLNASPAFVKAIASGSSSIFLLVGLGFSISLWFGLSATLESQKRFRELFETGSDWFWETDTGLHLTYVSPRFFQITGLEPEDVLGRTLEQFLVPESSGASPRAIPSSPLPFRGMEIAITGRSGEVRRFQISGKPSFYDNGVRRGLRGTGTDITGRRRAEAAAAQKAAQLAATIEVMPNGLIMFDESLNLTVHNQPFLDMWRLSEEQVQRLGCIPDLIRFLAERGDYGPGEIEALVSERLRAVVTMGKVSYRLRLANGRTLEIQGQGRPGTGYVLTYLDVTDRAQAEQALRTSEQSLRRSEERLSLALAVTRSGVWDIDLVNRVRWCTPQIFEMLGLSAADTGGIMSDFGRYVHPDDLLEMRRQARRHLSRHGNGDFRVQYRLRHREGRWLWFEDIGRAIHDEHGRAVRFIGTLVDVTERRATQAELMRSEKMAALGRLVAGVAHEINTPVGLGVSVASHLEERTRQLQRLYQAEEVTREDFEEFMVTAQESSQALLSNLRRAADLVRSFKQVAVDQASQQRRMINVREYIQEILLSLRPKLKKTPHRVMVNCPAELNLDSYPGALSQILTNLIDNSLIHAFAEDTPGAISIAVIADGTNLVLAYADNGKGMTAEESARIFEPFFTTRMSQGGSGLGMHIVYNLVTQTLGGRISCISLPGRGMSMTIRIPLVKGEVDEQAA